MGGEITSGLLFPQQETCLSAAASQSLPCIAMDKVGKLGAAVRQERLRRRWSQSQLAERVRGFAKEAGEDLKLSQQLIQQFESGVTKKMPRWYRFVQMAFEAADHAIDGEPDLPADDGRASYLEVELMPTFGGMGGGGTGEGDSAIALLPRHLLEDQLRGAPKDFLLIEVRGDSMVPEFLHGDQILVDRRDVNPRQPGPFALFDGDGVVVKLVERIPGRREWYRVFSANARYSEYEVQEEDVRIIGRPVWFARRL